uniref:E3 ubiquitin-protein ligase UHRF n=1 Tax=Cyprinus carpio TaxID=7962 RepID=A0A8C2IC73_CYPCA
MWIQIRTIDGKETRTVEDLSRLTKIESLRVKIRDIFNVKPEQQRLFYRGKQMEDGQTLFDYNVGLNDIVQLLIRSQTDPPDSPSLNNGEGVACAVSQPSTSSRTLLIDPGIGLFKVNELVDCRDVSIGAWFEGVIEKVSPASKGQNGRAETAPPAVRVGRPSKRTNCKLETETSAAPSSSSSSSSSRSTALNPDGSEPSTSKPDPAHVSYHIKYEDYPENGVVEMRADDVRPRARTLLRFDQLQVGDQVMVNYNLENPEERGFWYDAEITALNAVSRTNKEIHVRILLGGQGDVIGDCKLQFLDEVYRIEKPGAPGLSAADGPFKRKTGPECKHCKADPDAECRFCSCCVCGGKQDAHMQLLCDECNMAFHIYCLTPPLTAIPEDEDWYCPTCKNDSSEVVKAGEKLRTSKKKSRMPSATTESQRDWGKGMACVGRTKECTIVPSNHYGPVPGVPVGTTWKFRVQVRSAPERLSVKAHEVKSSSLSKTLLHHSSPWRHDVSGALVVAVVTCCCCQVVKYWPEIGKCGFLVWRYLLRRDDLEPAPWTPAGIERSKKLGLRVQYPPGYLEAMANKTKREATVRSVGGSKRGRKRGRPRSTRPSKRVKRRKEVESFVLSEQQRNLIQDDEPNRKLWDEALSFLSEGPNFLRKVEQLFMCVCCQELSFQPVTTDLFLMIICIVTHLNTFYPKFS